MWLVRLTTAVTTGAFMEAMQPSGAGGYVETACPDDATAAMAEAAIATAPNDVVPQLPVAARKQSLLNIGSQMDLGLFRIISSANGQTKDAMQQLHVEYMPNVATITFAGAPILDIRGQHLSKYRLSSR
jgi:hypothetical protein